MTKEAQNNKWRDRQADVLRENLKKRKALQKARVQEQKNASEPKTREIKDKIDE